MEDEDSQAERKEGRNSRSEEVADEAPDDGGITISWQLFSINVRAGSNGDVNIKVLRHHTVSVSNFQSNKIPTDDGMVHF